MPLTSGGLARLGVGVLAMYGLLPIVLTVYPDRHQPRSRRILIVAACIFIWALSWTAAPNFTNPTLLVALSVVRNVPMGIAHVAAANVDALVLSATVLVQGPAKRAARWAPVVIAGVLSTVRMIIAAVQNWLPATNVAVDDLTNALYDAIAVELAVAMIVSAAAAMRLTSMVMAGGKAGVVAEARRRFATEIGVYAGGCLVVCVLGLAGAFDIGTYGVAVIAGELQYVLRAMYVWAEGVVDKEASGDVSVSAVSQAAAGVPNWQGYGELAVHHVSRGYLDKDQAGGQRV